MRNRPGSLATIFLIAISGGCTGNNLDDLSPPVADAGGPQTVTVGQVVQFDGSGSHDKGGVITDWAWAFGDTDTTTGVRPVHVYGLPGFYTVTLTVTDNHGQSAHGTTEISVVPIGDGVMDAGTQADGGLDAGPTADAGIDGGQEEDAGAPGDAGSACGGVSAIEGGHWTYALTAASPRAHCGAFHAGPLVITAGNPSAATSTMTIKEAGTVVYTGTYTSATLAFTATNNDGLGDTQTLEGTFDPSFTSFTGNYVFNSTVLTCMETLDIVGMCG